MQDKNLTIKEIARLACVSTGTVDRVMHNRPDVSEKTRENVLKIIKELNYQPNLLARSLVSKKIFRIGVFLPKPSKTNTFWQQPLEGVIKAISEIGHFGIETSNYFYDFFVEEEYKAQAAKLLLDRPDAVVLAPFYAKESILFSQECDKLNIPYVYIDYKLEPTNYLSFVGQDASLTGYIAGKMVNLTTPSNSTVLIVNVIRQFDNTNTISRRIEGFKSFFKAQGNSKNLNIVDLNLNDTEESLNITLKKALHNTNDLKGIYVPNSRAYIVAEQIEKHQLEARNIVLLGHDIIKKNNAFLQKDIITILLNQRPKEQGYLAIMTLFNHLFLNRQAEKEYYMPIDIVTKENVSYFV